MKYAILLFMAVSLWSCATAPAGQMQVTGTVTTEGVECPAIRGEDGKIYTLAGGNNVPPAGTRVRVIGTAAEISTCMQGTTINVQSIEAL